MVYTLLQKKHHLFHISFSAKMAIHVSRDYVTINQKAYNLSFIILNDPKQPKNWDNFFHKITWDNNIPVPRALYKLNLGNNGTHIYEPFFPFTLTEDECSSWLKWATIRLPDEGDEVQLLQFKNDPNETLANQDNKTNIAAHIQHSLWNEQLKRSSPPVLGSMNRMEAAVAQQLSLSQRNMSNMIVNRLRNEFFSDDHSNRNNRPRRRSRSRSRSRSPIKNTKTDNHANPTPQVTQPIANAPLWNPYAPPQQYQYPQMYQYPPGVGIPNQMIPPQSK